MSVLPKRFYGDPSELVDELRRLEVRELRKANQTKINKGRRIRALVKQVMKRVMR